MNADLRRFGQTAKAYVLLQSVSDLIEPRMRAAIVEIGAGRAAGADRANDLFADHNATAEEHDVRRLARGAIESSPFARSASASVSFLNETAVYALSWALSSV